jgi:cobalt/nickel transport system permease protein
VVLASIGCAGQLAWSGTVSWLPAFTAMAGIHTLIGIGEGLISALVFAAVARTRPDLVGGSQSSQLSGSGWWLCGLVVALGLAIFVAPFACPWPDGLESVAARLGFEHAARQSGPGALAPDYALPGVDWPPGATALAGMLGVLMVFGLAWWLGRVLVPDTKSSAASSPPLS